MTQIEDAAATTVEVSTAADGVELTLSAYEFSIDDDEGTACVAIVMTPRQTRALAQQLLARADAVECGD